MVKARDVEIVTIFFDFNILLVIMINDFFVLEKNMFLVCF